MTIMVGSVVASRHGAGEGAKSLHPGRQKETHTETETE